MACADPCCFPTLHCVSQELDCILLKKQGLEVDNKSLRSKLQESELALVAARDECRPYEKRSQDLEQRLLRSQNEAQALYSRMESFLKEVQVMLGNEPAISMPKEEHVLERLREVCRREKSSTEVVLTQQTKNIYIKYYRHKTFYYFLWLTGLALVPFLHKNSSLWYSIHMLILFVYATVCYRDGVQTGCTVTGTWQAVRAAQSSRTKGAAAPEQDANTGVRAVHRRSEQR